MGPVEWPCIIHLLTPLIILAGEKKRDGVFLAHPESKKIIELEVESTMWEGMIWIDGNGKGVFIA